MVFKVLCFALLACTLVQAAPWNVFDEVRDFSDSFSTGVQKNMNSINEVLHAEVKATQSAFNTGVQAMETGATIITTVPRVAAGVLEKGSKLDGDNFKGIVGKILDENAESQKELVNSAMDTTKEIGNVGSKKITALSDTLTFIPRVFG